MSEFTDAELWEQAVDEDPSVRYDALHELAIRAIDARDFEQAHTITAAGLDAARAADDEQLLADALDMRAGSLWELGQHAEAAACLLDAAAHYQAVGMGGAAGLAHLRVSMCLADGQMVDGIMPNALKSLEVFAEEQFYGLVPHALLEVADRLTRFGRYDDGLTLIRASREYCIKHDVEYGLDHAKLHEAQLLHESGQSDMAKEMLLAWRQEALDNEDSNMVLRCTLGAAVAYNDTDEPQLAHDLVTSTLRLSAEPIEPQLMADLIVVDAQAMWELGSREPALARMCEAIAVLNHWGEALPDGDMRVRNCTFMRGEWLLTLDRNVEAEPVWRDLLRVSIPEARGLVANYLGHTLLELDRPAEALAVLEDEYLPLGDEFESVQPVWHECLIAKAYMDLEDWAQAAAAAERAIAAEHLHVPGTEGYLAELWEARALEVIDRNPQRAVEMLSRAVDYYALAEDETSKDDVLANLDCALALVASQWDLQVMH